MGDVDPPGKGDAVNTTATPCADPCEGAALIDVQEVARRLSLSPRTVAKLEKSNHRFPRPVRINSAVRWKVADVDGWIRDSCPA